MPRNRWRIEVRDQLAGMRHELGGMREELGGMRGELGGVREELGGMRTEIAGMREELAGLRGDLTREFERNRDVLRHLKASIDDNTEMTHRCVETLERVAAESAATRTVMIDLADDIRAQREGLLALIDQLRRDGRHGEG